MPRVFISHQSLDWDLIKPVIVSVLHENGIETWHYHDAITSSDMWERKIHEGLNECDWFLVAISENSCNSMWVRREVAWAERHRNGRIVPVLLDTSDPSDLHLALVDIQAISIFDSYADDQLVAVFHRQHQTTVILADSSLDADIESMKEAQESELAAKAGDIDGIYRIAQCRETGKGIDEDVTVAFQCYKLAADQGHAAAQYDLGRCYQFGIGTKSISSEAFKWYLTSAEQGYASGLMAVGWCYQTGWYQEKDSVLAMQYYRDAAENGDVQAMYNIGYCYQFGKCVREDHSESLRWYHKALNGGHPKAKLRIEEIKLEQATKDSKEFMNRLSGSAEKCELVKPPQIPDIDLVDFDKFFPKNS